MEVKERIQDNAMGVISDLLEASHFIRNSTIFRTIPEYLSTERATQSSTASTTSTTLSSTSPSLSSDTSLSYFFLALLVIPLLAVIGNSLVILSVLTQRKLRASHTNYYIASLATSDFFIGLVVIPFGIYHSVNNDKWMLGETVCKIYLTADVAASTASIMNLLVISVDRFTAIMFPRAYQAKWRRPTRALVIIAVIWVASISVAIPLLIHRSLGHDSSGQHIDVSTEIINGVSKEYDRTSRSLHISGYTKSLVISHEPNNQYVFSKPSPASSVELARQIYAGESFRATDDTSINSYVSQQTVKRHFDLDPAARSVHRRSGHNYIEDSTSTMTTNGSNFVSSMNVHNSTPDAITCGFVSPDFMIYSSLFSFYFPASIVTPMYIAVFWKLRRRAQRKGCATNVIKSAASASPSIKHQEVQRSVSGLVNDGHKGNHARIAKVGSIGLHSPKPGGGPKMAVILKTSSKNKASNNPMNGCPANTIGSCTLPGSGTTKCQHLRPNDVTQCCVEQSSERQCLKSNAGDERRRSAHPNPKLGCAKQATVHPAECAAKPLRRRHTLHGETRHARMLSYVESKIFSNQRPLRLGNFKNTLGTIGESGASSDDDCRTNSRSETIESSKTGKIANNSTQVKKQSHFCGNAVSPSVSDVTITDRSQHPLVRNGSSDSGARAIRVEMSVVSLQELKPSPEKRHDATDVQVHNCCTTPLMPTSVGKFMMRPNISDCTTMDCGGSVPTVSENRDHASVLPASGSCKDIKVVRTSDDGNSNCYNTSDSAMYEFDNRTEHCHTINNRSAQMPVTALQTRSKISSGSGLSNERNSEPNSFQAGDDSGISSLAISHPRFHHTPVTDLQRQSSISSYSGQYSESSRGSYDVVSTRPGIAMANQSRNCCDSGSVRTDECEASCCMEITADVIWRYNSQAQHIAEAGKGNVCCPAPPQVAKQPVSAKALSLTDTLSIDCSTCTIGSAESSSGKQPKSSISSEQADPRRTKSCEVFRVTRNVSRNLNGANCMRTAAITSPPRITEHSAKSSTTGESSSQETSLPNELGSVPTVFRTPVARNFSETASRRLRTLASNFSGALSAGFSLGTGSGRSGTMGSHSQHSTSTRREMSSARREHKATKLVAFVLACFICCWLPFFSANLYRGICLKNGSCETDDISYGRIFTAVTWLGYTNSVLNPILYTLFNVLFRTAFRKLLTCKCTNSR